MEIERKYKVKKDLWAELDKPAGEKIIQAYLCSGKDGVIRVRVRNNQGSMAIKGKTTNISREEFEFPVPVDIANEIIKKFAAGTIEKIRYIIPYKGKTWEVDEFSGHNEGLIIAEIELNSEDEVFELPEWVGKEVSDDSRYFNASLSHHPYEEWKDK